MGVGSSSVIVGLSTHTVFEEVELSGYALRQRLQSNAITILTKGYSHHGSNKIDNAGVAWFNRYPYVGSVLLLQGTSQRIREGFIHTLCSYVTLPITG